MHFHGRVRVLLCVDDDSLYDALVDALDSTLAVGTADEDEVLVAHVVATLRWLPARGNDSGWAGTERGILQKVDDFLERTVDVVTGKGVRAEALRLEGDVASELLKAADEREVDVIVTGAIGQARSQDFLVGSVAEKLVAVSERNLLLARTPTTSPSEDLRVIVAVDDTDASYQAIESFADKCRVDNAAIEIVHVMQVPPSRFDRAPEGGESRSSIPPIVRERADHAVNRANEIFSSRGLHPRLALRPGDPAREILAAARSFDADLVVVGHGERRMGTRLTGWRGTVTKRVAQHAPCSVFIAASDPSHRDEGTQGKHGRQNSRADGR